MGRLSPLHFPLHPTAAREGQLTSSAGSLGPSPGTTSNLCSDPPTCAVGGRHSLRSVPRAIHHRPLSGRPTLSKELQPLRKGGGRGPPEWAAALPRSCVCLLDTQPAGSTQRKVAQLARQVCLSSNRTQEDAAAVNPFLLAGQTVPRGREACLLAVPRRCSLRASAVAPFHSTVS